MHCEIERERKESRTIALIPHPPCHHPVQMISFLCLCLVAFTAARSLFEIEDERDYFEPRIIGGSEADIGRYSYTVNFEGPDDYGNIGHWNCGGSLIARDVILTAAHCQGFTRVIVGRHDIYDYDSGEVFDSFTELIHPLRVAFEPGIDNDVMLVFLVGESTADDVVTVRLNSDPSVPYVGQQLTAMGWGDTDADPGDDNFFVSDVLMNAYVTAISNEECDASEGVGDFGYYQAYKNVVTDTMLCATGYPQDICFGDSGGPLVVSGNDASSDVQVGIVSWHVGCATELPSAFARVSHFYDWIKSEVCKRSNYAPEAGFDCSDESDGILQPVNPCRICPYGIEDEYYVPYDWWTLSCRDAIDFAAQYETGSYECALISQWEICCPGTVENPCNICPDGATHGDEFKPFTNFEDDRTCGDLITWAANFEVGSDYCNIIGERHELYCCHPTSQPTYSVAFLPAFPTDSDSSEAPCAVCDGIFRPDMLVPFENLDGVTCEDIVLESSSVDCLRRQYAQALCCPTAASTCSICKGTQLSADVEVTDGTGATWTCREVAYYAAEHEPTSTNCTYYHSFEEHCCPDVFISSQPKGASCKVCDGDVRENMPIPGVDGKTCEDIVAHADTIDETSDDCAVLRVAEALCCPSAASTCSICKGTKLFADVEVVDSTGASLMCGEAALYVSFEDDANSVDCETYQAFEAYCCPVNYAASRTSSVTNPSSFPFINTSSHTYSSEALVRIFSTTPSSDTEPSKEKTSFTRPTTLEEEAAPSKISSKSGAVLAASTLSLIALTTAVIMSYFAFS